MRPLSVLIVMTIAGTAAAALAAPKCFTPSEAAAAHLRVLQQQFNVAALSCQTADPSDPSFASRYNQFVQNFAPQLQDNSEVLYHHFGRGSVELDRWITRIANDAGQKVITHPDFCQIAWDTLNRMIPLTAVEMQNYAVKSEAASDFAPLCPEKPPAKKKTAPK